MQPRISWKIIAAIGGLGVVAGIFSFVSYAELTSPQRLIENPHLTLYNLTGEEVLFKNYFGKPLVVNAWASWCTYCRRELPELARLEEEMGDRIVVIAVNRAEAPRAIRTFLDELSFSSADGLTVLADPGDQFCTIVGCMAVPETFFVGRDGSIQFRWRGPLPAEEARMLLERIL